ncbi:MAG: hypothetical protein WC683_11430 [bacterium]
MGFRKLITAAVIILFSALFFTCKTTTDDNGGGGGGGAGVDDDICGGATMGCIQGSVVDESDVGITVGATVTLDGALIATANTQGWYTASGIEAASRVFCFNATGYVEKCREILVIAKSLTPITPTVLAARGEPVAVPDAETGGEALDPANTGSSLTFDASELCDASGVAVSGTINCSFTPIDVSAVEMPDEAPNSFLSLKVDGLTRGISVSSALMEIYCDQNGVPLSVCAGKTVTVRIPVYGASSECQAKPASLPGWRFATDTAEWNEYNTGQFTKNCGGTPPGVAGANQYYQGEVDHISWIHAGEFKQSACLTGNVSGEPVEIAGNLVTAGCIGAGWRTESQIAEAGNFCVPAPVGLGYTCRVGDSTRWIEVADYITGTSPDVNVSFPVDSCPANGCYSIGDFVFDSPLLTTTLTWGKDPRDIDSHTRSENVHIFYNDQGALATAPYIALDTDDRFSYGPEVTTVMPAVFDGLYCFYVPKFAGDGLINQESVDLEGNPVRAVVSVQGAGIGKTFEIPSANPNSYEYWRIYTVEFEGGLIKEGTFTEYNDLVATEPESCIW